MQRTKQGYLEDLLLFENTCIYNLIVSYILIAFSLALWIDNINSNNLNIEFSIREKIRYSLKSD